MRVTFIESPGVLDTYTRDHISETLDRIAAHHNGWSNDRVVSIAIDLEGGTLRGTPYDLRITLELYSYDDDGLPLALDYTITAIDIWRPGDLDNPWLLAHRLESWSLGLLNLLP